MRAVSDTSPLSSLIRIGQTQVIPELFASVSIPEEVRAELASGRAPSEIQQWIAQPPSWLVIDSTALRSDAALDRLHAGERAAILLAEHLHADAVLLDEKAARATAVPRSSRDRIARGTPSGGRPRTRGPSDGDQGNDGCRLPCVAGTAQVSPGYALSSQATRRSGLRALLGMPQAPGSDRAARALETLEPDETVRASCAAPSEDLLSALRR